MMPGSPEGFYLESDPGINALTVSVSSPPPTTDEWNCKKVRKPYTISKSRESWSDPEHDKFLEALQLFDRDWKKIEAFIGSKTVIQIRSHAQKYFLKVQKSGSHEHLPPPRPKRKAAHPYPQKAPKNATPVSPATGSLQSSPFFLELGNKSSDSTSVQRYERGTAVPSSSVGNSQTAGLPKKTKGVMKSSGPSSSSESTPRAHNAGGLDETVKHGPPSKVLPDFAQVYNFIGSIFDPETSGHLHRLKKMDPIDVETALLLMRNLSINLSSPDFEDHRGVLSSYDSD